MLRGVGWVLSTGLVVGVLLVLFEAAVSEPLAQRPVMGAPGTTTIGPAVPYGGQLEAPDADGLEPGAFMGLGLLVLGLANGLVFAGAAALDAIISPSAAETRRRLRQRSAAGSVPGGWREVERTVETATAAPAASATPAHDDVPARRSVPGRPALGTTYAVAPVPDAVIPAPRRADPHADLRPAEAAVSAVPDEIPEPTPEVAAVPEPEPTGDPAAATPARRRPSPVPRDGGDGTSRATRRGSGPWGWRPARPDPVPWRNPVPAMAG
ncbi:hypothetical protein [Actinomycetospora sp. NBRC 106375]|uniref:hypothetical protein n=1 Tax=Actinomycetospora sp. NBRC 106375 TaxID=3032207 RepID=UPI002554A4A7|nr:hypothetical protein [Actinomycetospora sp. NBRC 106375]